MAAERHWQYDPILGWHQHTRCAFCEGEEAARQARLAAEDRTAATEGDRRMKAIRAAELTGDGGLIDIIREALLAANEDVYGDEGNVEALAALNELKGRLYERE